MNPMQSQSSGPAIILQLARQHLTACELRVTHTRVLVLTLLSTSLRPVAVEEVFGQLLRTGHAIGRTTVYRTLVEFERAGVVRLEWISGRVGKRAIYSLRKRNHD